MASSAHHLELPHSYATTAAPPPTPSTHPTNPLSSESSSSSSSSAAAADVLSRLLHRLPPTLSLPTRRSSPPTTLPPLISLSPQNPNLFTDLRSASSQLGFFQLTNHSVPSQLAHSAESDSLSLLNLPREQKKFFFPKKWPLGFDCDDVDHDDDDDDDNSKDLFCLDSSCFAESTELCLASVGEFTREMERVGLEVVEALSCAVGFENPGLEDPTRVCSLMWISEGSSGNNNKAVTPERFYPYVVGLHYQIRCQRYSLLADSGWVSVSPQIDSILVTLGDIAQVWSNGKIKKVRGRPVPSYGDGNTNNNSSRCISMSVLVTLPMESRVSPLLIPSLSTADNGAEENQVNKGEGPCGSSSSASGDAKEDRVFDSFSFEDYAWRVYHERLLLKDPLDRYRI